MQRDEYAQLSVGSHLESFALRDAHIAFASDREQSISRLVHWNHSLSKSHARRCLDVEVDTNMGLDLVAFTSIYTRIFRSHDPVKVRWRTHC